MKRRSKVLLAVVIGAASLTAFVLRPRRDQGEDIVVPSSTCVVCQPAHATGALSERDMDETSGLVASALHDGVFYAHNDSGDAPRFFAIDATGKRLATFDVEGAQAHDWEDIARGPCDEQGKGSCLFLGDIGDNTHTRSSVTIYRVSEPDTIASAKVRAEAFVLTYPDGARDAETLLVHPTTGVITIVSKVARGDANVYEAAPPYRSLGLVGVIRTPAGSARFTGGDVHPRGVGVLLRTYTHVYFVPMKPEQRVADAISAPLCSLPIAHEDQGESVAWLASGKGFVTIGEGKGVAFNETLCEEPR